MAAVALLMVGTMVVLGEQQTGFTGSATRSARFASASREALINNGSGYWLVSADGGVFTFGPAQFYGSLGGTHLGSPITGIVATADGGGYWLVAQNGAVTPFGDAVDNGSMSGKALNVPVVGGASTGGTGSSIPGPQGPTGAPGPVGPQGAPGTSAVSDYAEFYALMPGDNAANVVGGSPVQFPQDGPTVGTISRSGPGIFTLPAVGTYRVSFQVSVTEPGQLELELDLNGTAQAYTVVGRATGTSQLVGESLVTTTSPGESLEVINPVGNSPALTITPNAGGTNSVSASLVIQLVG